MILVTGGLGFIGSHTAQALLAAGETVVVATRRSGVAAPDPRLLVESVDCTDEPALLELGRRHQITGIVHLAGAGLDVTDPVDNLRASTTSLLNVLRAARLWEVPRVCLASTIGVYAGVSERPWREELPLPMVAAHVIPVA